MMCRGIGRGKDQPLEMRVLRAGGVTAIVEHRRQRHGVVRPSARGLSLERPFKMVWWLTIRDFQGPNYTPV